MSQLPGSTPEHWTELEREALAGALERLWSGPADGVSGLPEQDGSPAFDPSFRRELLERSFDPGEEDLRRIRREAERRPAGRDVERLVDGGLAATGPAKNRLVVSGQADPTVDNFLVDGSTARLVDFEDAGRSGRGFELASLIEHLANRHAGSEALADRFDVPAAELLGCRRVVAIYWFVRLTSDPAAAAQHPPGQVAVQNERLAELLGGRSARSGRMNR